MTKKLNEEHIRVAAYYLWENAGRPEGMEKEFWSQAYDQLMHIKSPSCKCSAKAKKPVAKTSVKVAAKTPVKACSKKSAVASSIVKTSLKPTVVAKPFYGIKK